MENQEFEAIPVPEEFHCSKTGSPFEKCLICESKLVDDLPYLIEKSYRKNEILFEYAMCYKCIEQFKSELSKDGALTVKSDKTQIIEYEHTAGRILMAF